MLLFNTSTVNESIRGLFEIYVIGELTNITVSILSNIVLVYLIIFKSRKELGAYKYLLLAFGLNDIYFPIVHLLTLPVICSYKDAFIMFSHGVWVSKVSICAFAAVFSQTMPLLAHLFIYRVIAVRWPTSLKYYSKASVLIVGITVLLEQMAWFFNCYYNYAPEPEMRVYVQPFLDEMFSGEGTEHIGALYWDDDGLRVRAFVATMLFNSIMISCSSIIIFCSVSIILKLRNVNVQWSDKTKHMQRALFYTLFVQMIIPMVFVYFPCAGIINLPMLGFRINMFPNLVSLSLTVFPVLDAIVITFGMESYRIALFGRFHKVKVTSVSDYTTMIL